MTTADRLRAAVEAALCNCDRSAGYRATGECWESCASRTRSAAVRAAVLLVEELGREREDEIARRVEESGYYAEKMSDALCELARLRAVLEWGANVLPKPCCASCGKNARLVMIAAAAGDWATVRAAGVALEEHK